MIRSKKRLWLCCILLGLNLTFIWGNSLLPGEISGAISGFFRDLIALILPVDGAPGDGHGLLRKLAHFTEFASLGMILTWLTVLLAKPGALALVGGFSAACIDETIQMFVPDRGPAFTDVLIDTSGVLAGVLILTLIHYWRRNHIIEN